MFAYPTDDASAKEARIAIHDPASGRIGGEVHLRPVDIDYIARLIGARGKMQRIRADNTRALPLARNGVARAETRPQASE
jgi:hypothetical protein